MKKSTALGLIVVSALSWLLGYGCSQHEMYVVCSTAVIKTTEGGHWYADIHVLSDEFVCARVE
jgi:hypothetical protein